MLDVECGYHGPSKEEYSHIPKRNSSRPFPLMQNIYNNFTESRFASIDRWWWPIY